MLKGNIEEGAVELARYIIENRTTVWAAAGQCCISKLTVHMAIYLIERFKMGRRRRDCGIRSADAVLDINRHNMQHVFCF